MSVQPNKLMREEPSSIPDPRTLWIVRIANEDCQHLNDVEVFSTRKEAEVYFRETLIWHLTILMAGDDSREESAIQMQLEAKSTDELIELFIADSDTVMFAVDVVERILDPGVEVRTA
ncbi:hypothetical protein [Methylobacterium sp. CM6247]